MNNPLYLWVRVWNRLHSATAPNTGKRVLRPNPEGITLAVAVTAPRYQDVAAGDIPIEGDDDGTTVKVIIGSFCGKTGPVDGIAANPMLLDVFVPPGRRKVLPVDTRANALAYVFVGSGTFRDASDPVGIKVKKEFRGQELALRELNNGIFIKHG